MKFVCPHCSSVITCHEADCGDEMACPDCLRVVDIPEKWCARGVVVGDFMIQELLGAGGMGRVFLAEQLSLKRPVALKILHEELAESPRQLEQFLNEARLAASINHPNLIGVYAVGEQDERHYIAMEYVDGKSVLEILNKRGPMPVPDAARIVLEAAAGLQAAWDRRGIVHCDVKPENILIPEEGGVKIADMGLAEGLAAANPGGMEGVFAGSPYYVCPEIILGQKLDHRSDLYSLGATFFEMLTGRPPYEGTDLAEVAGRHLYDSPPDPRQFIPDLPEPVCRIIERLLRKDPAERYQCGDELIQAIQVDVLVDRPLRDTSGKAQATAAPPSRWKCPSCARLNSESSRYCLDCGTYGWHPCPLCGEDIPINAQFCPHCGGNLIEQRQGIIRQAQHLLQEMHEAVKRNDYDQVTPLIAKFRDLDPKTLPELDQSRFSDILKHVQATLEKQLDEAREGLRIDLLEGTAEELYQIFGTEGYQWLKQEVAQLKSDLAQAVYQAGAALKSNCFLTCESILDSIPAWRGGSIGERLEELGRVCKEKQHERAQIIDDAKAVLEAADTDYGDAVLVSWRLVSFRISRKILVVPPIQDDNKIDAQLESLATELRQLVYKGVKHWVKEEQWEALADLLSTLRGCEGIYLLDQEKFVSDCVKQEVRKRYEAALKAEKEHDVRTALKYWNEVLRIPPKLLPRQIRREALGFPARRSRLLVDQRRPLLRAHLSAVFFLWCFAFALAVLELVQIWLDDSFQFAQLREYAIPLMVQLTAIGLFAKLLNNKRVMASSEVIPLRQPPVFVTGMMLLWILSPLNSVVTNSCAHAGALFSGLDVLVLPWVGPLVVLLFWLCADLVMLIGYRSPLTAFGMSLSWLVAVAVVYALWNTFPDTPLLQVGSAMYQAMVFLALHAANYCWWRNRSDGPPLHPALATSRC